MRDDELRSKGITATEISAIAGVNPYMRPIDVYMRKLNLIPPQADNTAMKWGRKLEPLIVEEYCERTGYEVEEVGTLVHPEYEFVIGTPDRLIKDASIVMEAKTVGSRQSHRWGDEGTDLVPEEYLLQCAYYMAITNREECHLAAFFLADRELRLYRIPRDKELEELLIELAANFWLNHILTETPPTVDGSESSANFIKQKYPSHRQGDMVQADSEAEECVWKLKDAKARLAEVTEEVGASENILKLKIGEHAGLIGRFGKITWKATKPRDVTDWEGLALSFKPTDEQIKQFTTLKPGYRRFLVKYEGE